MSTKPESTKKNVTPKYPWLKTVDIGPGNGANTLMWKRKTAKAAHQRRPVSASSLGILRSSIAGLPSVTDSPTCVVVNSGRANCTRRAHAVPRDTIGGMPEPLVDITIAVHSRTRPIARAAASVLDHTEAPVRVNVVAHNIDPEIIRENLGDYADDPRLRLLHLADGIPSPAGPMNHGFASSTAPYISVMGSDDELAPGAVDSWLALAQRTGAQMVLARIQLPSGRTDPYPPVRNGRRAEGLDPIKDRLPYRSAPLGLIDRARFGELRLTEGLPSGEDLAYSLTVWFTADRLTYDLHGPAYVINADAGDRVTSAPRAVSEDFRFLDEVESFEWFRTASRAARCAIVVKLIRIHFFDAVLVRTAHPSRSLRIERTWWHSSIVSRGSPRMPARCCPGRIAP